MHFEVEFVIDSLTNQTLYIRGDSYAHLPAAYKGLFWDDF
ncbi:MAG: hypothetical protein ACJAZT_001123 [Gammaproteobacteria bacterium]|jgi:hypothetical protein